LGFRENRASIIKEGVPMKFARCLLACLAVASFSAHANYTNQRNCDPDDIAIYKDSSAQQTLCTWKKDGDDANQVTLKPNVSDISAECQFTPAPHSSDKVVLVSGKKAAFITKLSIDGNFIKFNVKNLRTDVNANVVFHLNAGPQFVAGDQLVCTFTPSK
jgi:hypothetical protein